MRKKIIAAIMVIVAAVLVVVSLGAISRTTVADDSANDKIGRAHV